MGVSKPREQRRVVFVTCRLRDDSGWSDLTICNLSAHGLMARCNKPPPRGAFVEVRKGAVTIVGQVRWSRDNRMGIRSQERIDMLSLLEERSALDGCPKDDRRGDRRKRGSAADPAALATRSRQWSRLFEWLVIAAVGIGAAGLLAAQVHLIVSLPLERATAALEP